MSLLADHWHRLIGAIHPDDEPIFKKYEHTFNLCFPPPAFVGNPDARIVILMANGGYAAGTTEAEFRHPDAASNYISYLRGETGWKLPPHMASYYGTGRVGELIARGDAMRVNEIAYRSPRLSKEAENKEVAENLPSLEVHRRWLRDEVVPAAKKQKRYILAHRYAWWKLTPTDSSPCTVFSDSRTGEPNRRSPDRKKIEEAEDWLGKLT